MEIQAINQGTGNKKHILLKGNKCIFLRKMVDLMKKLGFYFKSIGVIKKSTDNY